MAEFKMPSLGADMEEGTLVEWQVAVGDTVSRGQIVAAVETQKGVIEVEIWQSGTIESLLAKPGDTVSVGSVMAIIHSEGEVEAPSPSAFEAASDVQPRNVSEIPKDVPIVAGKRRHLRVSPLARRIAEQHHVDLGKVHGSGPQGAITRKDVEEFVAGNSKEKPRGFDSYAMRQAIAAAMAKSKREIPHYYLQTKVDMGPALAWLAEFNAERSTQDRVLPAALITKAVARAATKVPEMNGYWIEGDFHPCKAVHLGLGISLRQGGLVAPAMHDADQKDLVTIMQETLDLVKRARSGRLRSSEFSDPSLTLTNLGDQGVSTVFGVIYPPQVACIGAGKIIQEPWAQDGMLTVRPVLNLSLSADHRASDGLRGGIFLNKIAKDLNHPEGLM